MSSLTLHDFTLHYSSIGIGEPLVLLHGFGERKEGWKSQHALANQYRLIIPDLRGHGQSSHFRELSMKLFAEDILGLLDAMSVHRAHICGLSMGGIVAQEMYRLAPERFRTLILMNTFYYVPYPLRALYLQSWMWRASLPLSIRKSLYALTCLTDWRSDTLECFYESIKSYPDTYQQTLEASLKVNNSSLLSKIQVPTLVVGSEYDLLTPVWVQAAIHHLIKGSEFVILHQAGHMVKLERPEELNRIICEFLEKHRDEAGTSEK